MEEYALLSARIICTTEGLSGLILNVALIFSLLQRSPCLVSATNIYRIPIFVSSIQGFFLCTLISVMNYVHIFREGTFVIALFGPLVPLIPREICHIGVEIALVLTTMMWTLIPSTATLQLTALARSHWSPKRRLAISFIFTLICVFIVGSFTPDFIPTPQFNEFIEQITTDLYKINSYQSTVVVGTTIVRTDLNDDRSMLRILIFFVMLPYVSSYAYFLIMVFQIRKRLRINGSSISERTIKLQRSFFLMQMLQGFLPLAIISIPYIVFIIGALLHSNLDFVTLLFTVFLWICPVVQAAVQLRFVRESNARSSEEKVASTVSTTRLNIMRIPSQTGG